MTTLNETPALTTSAPILSAALGGATCPVLPTGGRVAADAPSAVRWAEQDRYYCANGSGLHTLPVKRGARCLYHRHQRPMDRNPERRLTPECFDPAEYGPRPTF